MLSATTLREHFFGESRYCDKAGNVSPGPNSWERMPLGVFSLESKEPFLGEGIRERARILLWDESGASMVEYGLMVALISLVALASITSFGQAVNTHLYAAASAAAGS